MCLLLLLLLWVLPRAWDCENRGQRQLEVLKDGRTDELVRLLLSKMLMFHNRFVNRRVYTKQLLHKFYKIVSVALEFCHSLT